MKIAVTGASGFVGTHVLAALARYDDIEVVAASRTPVPADRLPAQAQSVAFDIAASSSADYDRLGRPDVLIHLAWSGLPNYLSPHHFDTELPAQYRFLRTMIEAGLTSLVVTGTCYEYGMLSGELTEEMGARPANPYAHAKVSLLRQLEYLQTERTFALTWARLFYMYGPGQAPTSILPLLRAAVERGDQTFPMSKGEQLRDYLRVEEVARLLVELALRRDNAGLVNVCSGEPISVRRLVEEQLAANNWKIELELGKYPYPAYEPLAFWGSRRRLDRILGSSPSTECQSP